jgi:uncharacterized membrane protein YeaQ/YmgE (transglycosylase-associated protein family)
MTTVYVSEGIDEERKVQMGQMGWLAWLIVGGVAGLFANSVMHSRMGLIADIIIGVLGALAGGFLFSLIGVTGVTGFNLWSVFVAFVGAVILLGVIRMVSRNRHIAY